MPKAQNRFTNPYFDRFVDNAMMGAVKGRIHHDYRNALSKEDKYALANKTEWLAQASLDEKLLLLTRLGYPFAIVCGGPQKQPNTPELVKMVRLFFKGLSFQRHRAIQVLRDKFLFALTDVDFLKGIKLAASVFNSPAGATFAGYNQILKGAYQYKTEAQKTMLRDVAAGHDIDGIVMNAMHLATEAKDQEGFKALYGINEKQYRILALLSKLRMGTLKDIYTETSGPKWIRAQLLGLMTMKLVEKKTISNEVTPGGRVSRAKTEDQYWLTGLGEQTLLKARNHFISHL